MAARCAALLCTALLLAGCAAAPARDAALASPPRDGPARLPADADAPVLLVSIDGFRADYLDRGLTPTLQALADAGVRAEYMRPSYPSITFPNHYTLVTGLRPDRHGVVANFMTDPTMPGVRFSMFDRATVGDARWWNDGRPLWTSVREHGGRAATMFWVGSEAPVHGAMPEYWRPFDIAVDSRQRVEQVLGWLALAPAERPHLITLYFDIVDTMGHLHGPDSPELDAALAEVDAALATLVAGIDAQGLGERVNLVVVSDHGMAATGPDRELYLDDLVDVSRLDFLWTGAYASFDALPGGEDAARQLLGGHPHMTCTTRDRIPERYRFGTHRRVPAYFCEAEPGWQVTTRDAMQRKGHRLRGEHGYDNRHPDMRAPFIAHGPAFRRGAVIPAIDNVDVYPLLAHLLAIPPADNDGDLAHTRDALVPGR
ncbi:ectonucleotide pyrophosphatase/phosphodiesterase [Luteimonas sp. BDR2-5]|uniref:alkaline phosphatase family protein n=1 Tax=Proluteimonas luteida TaxID=2878685 RepID=UPI001E561B63|nr:ectonucleotide pyrophosphatase/phosphodiesterase [Luteimonas sp. BDR2-5]MCD9027961.1 ectonucleotide pyrophosphatase/phosphodiesterase [Luteimonas sp. BDR2-5]